MIRALPVAFLISCATAGAAGFTLYQENDAVFDSDGDYTNGVKLVWSTPAPGWLPVAGAPDLAVALGQSIYTPSDIDTAALIPDDRPYAGWLYLGLAAVWDRPALRDTVALDLGMVGPASFAQEFQGFVHDIYAIDRPRGWANQLENEFAFTLAGERVWRIAGDGDAGGWRWEILPHAGAALGTVRTGLNAGAELRAGWNLPDDFGTPTLSPTAMVLGATEDFGFHAFGRCDDRFVLHDIFLDGNTFRESHSVDRRPFVAEFSAGIAATWRDARVSYAWVYRTSDFEEQDHGQAFATFTLGLRF